MSREDLPAKILVGIGGILLVGFVGFLGGAGCRENAVLEAIKVQRAIYRKLEDGTEGLVIEPRGSPNGWPRTVLLRDSDGVYRPLSYFEESGREEVSQKYRDIQRRFYDLETKSGESEGEEEGR